MSSKTMDQKWYQLIKFSLRMSWRCSFFNRTPSSPSITQIKDGEQFFATGFAYYNVNTPHTEQSSPLKGSGY
jgi:hypothetical protein